MTISRIIWAILCHIYRQYTQSYGMSVLDTLLIGSDPVAAVLLCINGKLFSSAFIFCLGLFSKFASLSALNSQSQLFSIFLVYCTTAVYCTGYLCTLSCTGYLIHLITECNIQLCSSYYYSFPFLYC